jgi:small GTP-binding protein
MSSIPTIGIDKFFKIFQLSDGTYVNCSIYDTAGQERYESLSRSYFKRADAVLLVYDISDKKSFKRIKDYYIKAIKENCKKDITILLLGNKADLENERQVSIQEGVDLALKEKFEFKESSCLQNKNVAGAFESLIERWNHQNSKVNSFTDTYKENHSKKKMFKNAGLSSDEKRERKERYKSCHNFDNIDNIDNIHRTNTILTREEHLRNKKKKKFC